MTYKEILENEYKLPRFKEGIEYIQSDGKNLAPYAAIKPTHDRRYALDLKGTKIETRSDFQRDRDRIIHSNAFRRLQYKTQVFVNHEGDHYRTRLTHSLEVSQISRGIARSLGANEDLTEAIALGHDLGHTPFGHSVESLLSDILKNEGGFFHNEQSLRIVDKLETKTNMAVNQGLNLTWDVREGILKHNKDRTPGIYESLSPNKPPSIEGQIVALVDRVAYVCHDLEDGLRAGLIEDGLNHGLISLDKDVKSFLKDFGITLKGESARSLRNLDISRIITVLVEDIVKSSIEVIITNNIDSIEKVRHFINKETENNVIIIGNFQKPFKTLKSFVKNNIYQSSMASIMDEKAKYFIRMIYDSYWANHKQLPSEIYNKFCKAAESENEDIDENYDGYRTTPSRVLCDYISTMTDRYALEEYDKLFNPHKKIYL